MDIVKYNMYLRHLHTISKRLYIIITVVIWYQLIAKI